MINDHFAMLGRYNQARAVLTMLGVEEPMGRDLLIMQREAW